MMLPTCVIKFLELMLTISCLALHHYSYDLTDVTTLMLCSGTYVGYAIVLSGEIVGEMLFAPLDLVQDMYFGLLGVGLFSVSGGLILTGRSRVSENPRTGDYTMAMIVGSLAIVNAILMFFDLSLAYLDSEDVEEFYLLLCTQGETISSPADAYVDAWWSASGGLLFGASGVLTLRSWRDVPDCARKHHASAAAVCALVTAAVFTVDALLALCSANRDEHSNPPKFGGQPAK